MRKSKKVEIEGKTVVVKELATKDVIEIFDTDEGIETVLGLITGNPDCYIEMFDKTVELEEGIGLESVCEGINGFTKLQQAFDEVNKDFLESLPARAERLAKLANSPFLRSASAVKNRG